MPIKRIIGCGVIGGFGIGLMTAALNLTFWRTAVFTTGLIIWGLQNSFFHLGQHDDDRRSGV